MNNNLEFKDAPAGVETYILQCLQAVIDKRDQEFQYLITKGRFNNVDIAVVTIDDTYDFHYGYKTTMGGQIRGVINLNEYESKDKL